MRRSGGACSLSASVVGSFSASIALGADRPRRDEPTGGFNSDTIQFVHAAGRRLPCQGIAYGYSVTRSGTRPTHHLISVNGIPIRILIVECKSPTLGEGWKARVDYTSAGHVPKQQAGQEVVRAAADFEALGVRILASRHEASEATGDTKSACASADGARASGRVRASDRSRRRSLAAAAPGRPRACRGSSGRRPPLGE